MNSRLHVLIGLCLVILTLAVFVQVRGFDYAGYDDGHYITENARVQAGLTLDGIRWAFTTRFAGYWHPVTWIVHMLGVQLFGLNPAPHHLINLFFHVINVLLLFSLLLRLTGATWRSAFVAALFAIHPLHVESVAWIAEQKDVLSTLFWLVTVHLYVNGTRRSLALALVVYAVGLMTKPMLVSLPIILLLLDIWPLGRFAKPADAVRLVVEKIPFLLLSAASCAITFLTTRHGGVVASAEQFPLFLRLQNTVVAYAGYLYGMFWPDRMAVLYPYRAILPAWEVGCSALFLAAVTVAVAALWRTHRYLLAGWLWFLVMLLPVIGIVQAGSQAMADRYTYLSLVGPFIMIAWGASEFVNRRGERARTVVAVLAAVLVCALAVRAWFQARHWRSAMALYEHALAVTEGNYAVHNNLALILVQEGRFDEAMAHYQEAIRLNPEFAYSHNNYGNALLQVGRLNDAVAQFHAALKLNPDYAEARNNLGITLAKQGKLEDAIEQFLAALKIKSDDPRTVKNLGIALGELKNPQKVQEYLRRAGISP